MIAIEKGVPMPKPRAEQQSYPWADMEVGDSFFIAEADRRASQKQLTAMAAYYRKAHGKRFTVRQVEGGVRVWRLA